MYLLVVKGKGTSFYNIWTAYDIDIFLKQFKSYPFSVQLFSALEMDEDRASKILSYLWRYFSDVRVNDCWFNLSFKQAQQLQIMLDDPDNFLSDDIQSGELRQLALVHRLWDKLDDLAKKTNSLGEQGVDLGQPSWKMLFKRIARNPKLLGMIERELNGVEISLPRQYQEAIIVRPEETKTETLAWLRVDGDRVSVEFPEKCDDFREIVKGQNYRWQETEWVRFIGAKAGDPIHRTAELGCNLLANGFSVIFPDESIREMAVSGEYEPECRRQVLVRTSGEYEGWFVLWWRRSEDCYEAAKQITASRYDKPHVVVPPEHYAEVIDFAQIHKFRFSQAAFELVTKAKAMRESALIVSIEDKEIDWSDKDLNIPELGWDDEDLADDIPFEDT